MIGSRRLKTKKTTLSYLAYTPEYIPGMTGKVFSSELLNSYCISLKGVRRARRRLQRQLRSIRGDDDLLENREYKIELLRAIESSYESFLARYDKRFKAYIKKGIVKRNIDLRLAA